jgi:hypothetical protein
MLCCALHLSTVTRPWVQPYISTTESPEPLNATTQTPTPKSQIPNPKPQTPNPQLNALAIGGFLSDILAIFSDTVTASTHPGTPAPKLSVFSGHDSTLFPLLTALGAFDGGWPPYASYLTLELLRVRGSGSGSGSWGDAGNTGSDAYRVRLIYNGRMGSMLSYGPGELVPYGELSVEVSGVQGSEGRFQGLV